MSGDRKIERVKKGEKQVRQVELGEEAAGGGVGGDQLTAKYGWRAHTPNHASAVRAKKEEFVEMKHRRRHPGG